MELLLEEALQALPPDEHAGIVAHFFEGRDFQEIAEMFVITEDAARKRTSRCLAKLQNFMAKRGARVSSQTLSGLLLAQPTHEAAENVLQSAIDAVQAAWKGKATTTSAVALANHAVRLLRWRFLTRLSLNLALLNLLLFVGFWALWERNRPLPTRIETLGRAWGALDQRVAAHKQFLMQTAPNTPDYQAKLQQQLGAISRESSRIIVELNPLLAPPDERTHLAQFLTAELDKTLNLELSKKTNLFSYIQNRLVQGTNLNDAMKSLAETTQTEAADIKVMLSPAQQQLFDEVYGADGALLFSYAKAVALGRIGA